MSQSETLDRRTGPAKCGNAALKGLTLAATFAGLVAASSAARAVDGCLVLLCLAAPSWSAIPQCVPPIREVLRDLARGRPFPTCGIAGAGNGAANQWAGAPSNCPPQYTHEYEAESGSIYTCDYAGVVSVNISGTLWSRTWWNMGGSTVTEYAPAAKAQLGTWDTRFDDDYAIWLASLPPPPLPCAAC